MSKVPHVPVLTLPEGAALEIVDHGLTGLICDDESDMAAAVGRIDEGMRRLPS